MIKGKGRRQLVLPRDMFNKPLEWERLKLKKKTKKQNIKAVLDSTYKARMTKRQKRTAAKVCRVSR